MIKILEDYDHFLDVLSSIYDADQWRFVFNSIWDSEMAC